MSRVKQDVHRDLKKSSEVRCYGVWDVECGIDMNRVEYWKQYGKKVGKFKDECREYGMGKGVEDWE